MLTTKGHERNLGAGRHIAGLVCGGDDALIKTQENHTLKIDEFLFYIKFTSISQTFKKYFY